jgi:alkanesulfonate monooxygenase SsuD/methylene tetrahydromethanopterin reductase-like flavin-dependent oxidoreductase (luciferase family)
MSLIGITMPSRTAPLRKIPEFAQLADAAGFDSVWSWELYKNPFAMLCTSALATDRATLGTGLAAAFCRSPFEAANAAADVDELSGGRMLLGLGTGLPEAQHGYHSVDTTGWVGRMREYIRCIRLGWQYLGTGEVEPFEGRHYRFVPPAGDPWGLRELARPTIPIYLAAHGPMMMQLAGEIADGWIATLTSPKWVRERVRPELEKGARKTSRDPSEVGIAVEVVCSVHPDRELAYRRAKVHIGFYCMHPLIDAVVELHGLEAERDAVRAAVMQRGLAALPDTPDALVDALAIAGTPEEARQKLAEWQEEIPHIVFHTPYVPPLTADESEDIYRNIVAAFTPAERC